MLRLVHIYPVSLEAGVFIPRESGLAENLLAPGVQDRPAAGSAALICSLVREVLFAPGKREKRVL
jgi:hypothetical protein